MSRRPLSRLSFFRAEGLKWPNLQKNDTNSMKKADLVSKILNKLTKTGWISSLFAVHVIPKLKKMLIWYHEQVIVSQKSDEQSRKCDTKIEKNTDLVSQNGQKSTLSYPKKPFLPFCDLFLRKIPILSNRDIFICFMH
jgi:hypothetical protein